MEDFSVLWSKFKAFYKEIFAFATSFPPLVLFVTLFGPPWPDFSILVGLVGILTVCSLIGLFIAFHQLLNSKRFLYLLIKYLLILTFIHFPIYIILLKSFVFYKPDRKYQFSSGIYYQDWIYRIKEYDPGYLPETIINNHYDTDGAEFKIWPPLEVHFIRISLFLLFIILSQSYALAVGSFILYANFKDKSTAEMKAGP